MKEKSKDELCREFTDYIFNQLEPFLEQTGNVNDEGDVRKIIFKLLKVFYKQVN